MALIECTECGSQVSDKAKACPKCGAPVEPPAAPAKPTLPVHSQSWWARMSLMSKIGVVAVAVVIGISLRYSYETRERAPTTAAKAPTQADLELTAAVRVARGIKSAMKNPSSFDLDSLLIFPGGATCYVYRGTNSFNAVVTGRAVYLPGSNEILLQANDGERFVNAWNDTCSQPGGKERGKGLKLLGQI